MAANWRFYVGLGFAAFLLTYYFSWENNTWQTSLIRAGFGFILFTALGFLCQFLLYVIGANQEEPVAEVAAVPEEKEGGAFQSIPLASLHGEKEIEQAVGTIRGWTSQDREG